MVPILEGLSRAHRKLREDKRFMGVGGVHYRAGVGVDFLEEVASEQKI